MRKITITTTSADIDGTFVEELATITDYASDDYAEDEYNSVGVNYTGTLRDIFNRVKDFGNWLEEMSDELEDFAEQIGNDFTLAGSVRESLHSALEDASYCISRRNEDRWEILFAIEEALGAFHHLNMAE